MQPVWLDLDWFCIDSAGEVAHFASAGGHVPPIVLRDVDAAIRISKFIEGLPEIGDAIINPNLEKFSAKIGDMSSFMHFAHRGFYSFDKTKPQFALEHKYHLMASPAVLLRVESLPSELLKYIVGTKFNGYFKECPAADVTSLVELNH